MLHTRIPILLLCALILLSGCVTTSGKSTPEVNEAQTYFIRFKDHSTYEAVPPLKERISKELSDDNLTTGEDLQSVDWPMHLLLTQTSVQQLQHDDLGSPPLLGIDPLTALVNAVYFVGWSAKEAGKQAINAGTPNTIIRMRLHVLDKDGTLWRISDEVPLYTLNKDRSRDYVSRELSAKVDEYLAMFRSGEVPENAVKETSTYEIKLMTGEIE